MEKEVKDTPESVKEVSTTEKSQGNEVVSETKHSNNKVLIIVLIVVGVLTFLGIAGAVLLGTVFRSAGEKLAEEATNTNITTNKDGTATYESKDGDTSVSTEQKLPTDFPTNIPLYSDQKITGSSKQKTASGNYWQVTSETSDAITKVVSNVKEAYSKAPWETEAEVEINGSSTLSYAKTGYKVTVIISENSDMDMTSLIYSVTQETETE
jgi:hypothetical protein